MEGKNVLNLLNLSQNQSLNTVSGVQKASASSKSLGDLFASYMNNSPNKNNFSADNDLGGSLNNASAETDYNKFQYKDNSIKSNDNNPIKDKIDESAEKLKSFEDEVVSSISEELGLDEEEVVEAMENLGLSAFDLLNPQNLAQLVIELTGLEDASELVLDDKFLNILSDISTLGKELMSELEVNPEQMQAMVELLGEMEEVETETSLDDLGVDLSSLEDSSTSTVNQGGEQEAELAGDVATVFNTEKAVESQAENEITNKVMGDDALAEETVVAEKETDNSQDEDLLEENESESNTATNSGKGTVVDKEENSFGHVVVNTDNQQTGQLVQETTTVNSYTTTETVTIIEQIVEHVKTTVTEETTSLEMQLNPANLGKVLLNISSKQGTVSAQFTATNEIVKEALEAQLANLKENLNQSGVKVDAIEVTVASHEFERNLEQDQSRQEQEGSMQEKAMSNRRRNINLDSLDELSGLMTEEESLVAQMMIDNGNSVDLTA